MGAALAVLQRRPGSFQLVFLAEQKWFAEQRWPSGLASWTAMLQLHQGNSEARYSVARLVSLSGVARATVYRCIRRFVEEGFLSVKGSLGGTSRYIIRARPGCAPLSTESASINGGVFVPKQRRQGVREKSRTRLTMRHPVSTRGAGDKKFSSSFRVGGEPHTRAVSPPTTAAPPAPPRSGEPDGPPAALSKILKPVASDGNGPGAIPTPSVTVPGGSTWASLYEAAKARLAELRAECGGDDARLRRLVDAETAATAAAAAARRGVGDAIRDARSELRKAGVGRVFIAGPRARRGA